MSDRTEEIKKLTELLRTGGDPFWARLRQCLGEHGVDPDQSLLVRSFEDDIDYEFGVLVTSEGRVFQFGFSYIGTGDVEDGDFVEWNDLTDSWRTSPYREAVACGFDIGS